MTAPERSGRGDAAHCFVCGTTNPIGLGIAFEISGERCTGTFTSGEDHVGFDGVTHGGIIFSVLDDAMANWFYLQGARGYTAKSEIRYREAMPVGASAAIECEMVKRKGRLVQLRSRATNQESGHVIAECDGSFMLEDFGNLGPS